MNAKKLFVTAALALIGAPVATAGTDTGIGIPAGRDVVSDPAPLVSEKTAGLFRVQEPAPLVSEKTAGLFQVQQPSPLASEKTTGLWRTPAPVSFASPAAAPNGGFDWSDASVGAGITIASLLLASAGALAIRRRGLPAH